MPEETKKNIYTVKKPGRVKDIYKGIETHYESERNEGPEGGPGAVMKDVRGPIVLSPSTYIEEDISFEEKKKKQTPKRLPEGK